jgi:hypothetical protein
MPDPLQDIEKVSSLPGSEPKSPNNGFINKVEDMKQSLDACPEKADSNVDMAEPTPLYETITAKELGLLSTAFTIATFMIALDGNILGKSLTSLVRVRIYKIFSYCNSTYYE